MALIPDNLLEQDHFKDGNFSETVTYEYADTFWHHHEIHSYPKIEDRNFVSTCPSCIHLIDGIIRHKPHKSVIWARLELVFLVRQLRILCALLNL